MTYLDLWGRRLGIPYNEYASMPMGELGDMVSAYQVTHGVAKEVEREIYIPNLR